MFNGDIQALCETGESQWLERKSFRIKGKDLAKAFVAMANAEGGVVAVGVSNRQPEGLPTIAQENEIRQATFDFCDPTVPVRINVTETTTPDGKPAQIFVCEIEASDRVHSLKNGECFLRVGDETKQLRTDQILELRYSKGEQQFDVTPAPTAERDDLDDKKLAAFATVIGASSVDSVLNARSLLTREGKPTVAAILCFGKNPQRYFLNAYIRVLRWGDSDRLPGVSQQLLFDERFEGTLEEQVADAAARIDELLPKVKRLSANGNFEWQSVIPRDVWLEGLVNAVVHRSYSMIGDHIRFEIYPDRIEVSSPGRFPGLADPRKPLSIARFARNPSIARIAAELRIGQELGEGIKRMFFEMHQVGLAEPVYSQNGNVILTLRAQRRINDAMLAELPTNADTVLAALGSSQQPLGTSEVAAIAKLSVPTARRVLAALRDKGLIAWEGKSPKDPRAVWRIKPPLK